MTLELMDKGKLLPGCCVYLLLPTYLCRKVQVTEAMVLWGLFIKVVFLTLLEELVIFSKFA